MIIENLDSLKSWLIQTLTPICDADPDTLSKYVIALVKKEKPYDELRDVCFRELDVFLQDKTKGFVSKLFDALQSNSYLTDLEARSKERPTKEPTPVAPHAPKEAARLDQRTAESNYNKPNQNYKPNQPYVDRKEPADFPAWQDGAPPQKSRLMPPREHSDDGVKVVQEIPRGVEHGFHGQKRPGGAYPLRSPRTSERGHHSGYRSDAVVSGGGPDRSRIDGYDPVHQNDVRSRRPRPSSLTRRVENPNRRDYPPLAAPPKHSATAGQDGGRYLNERLRRFPSHEKMVGSNPTTRFNSPIRSPELDRPDDRYLLSQQQQQLLQQQQQPPWPGQQHHRDLKRLPDAHERFGQPPRIRHSPFSHSRSRTRSRTASRTPSRSVERTLAARSSRSRSGSPGRSRSRSLSRTGRSSRSRSPMVDMAMENKQPNNNLDQEVIDSRSSTPLEEEDYRASSEPLLKIKYDSVRPLTRPRCRDYDDKGFCVRGDLCEFDHGTDPVVLKNDGYPSGLGPSLLPQGPPLMAPMPHMSRPMMSQMPYPDHHPQSMMPPTLHQFSASDGGASYLPPPPHHMMSSMPPHIRDFQLYPPPLAPPHLRPFPMMPPPFITNRPMALRPEPVRNMADMYQPMMQMMPVEPYMPEPYTPKSTGYQATPKADEKWEASNNVDPNFMAQQQRLGPVQISANRHTNLVRVPTDEVRTTAASAATDENADAASAAQRRVGLKRSADVLDAPPPPPSDSTPAVVSNSVQPPPMKKTAFEHPGVRHGATSNNTTLELRKIPREQNMIANINDHFSKFGIIVNLQVGWEGDPQAALVSFASNAQAQLAYRSQEPFLNNRFIKIFWHNAEKPPQNQTQATSAPAVEAPRQRIVIPERHKLQLNNTLRNAAQAATAQAAKNAENLANQPAAKNAATLVKNVPADLTASATVEAAVAPPVESITSPPAAVAAPAAVVDAVKKTVPEAMPVGSTRIQRRTSKDIASKEVLVRQRQFELQKKSQELLQKQIEQQKILLQKLEKDKATLSADEKTSIITTIKKLAKTIEELKTVCAMIKPNSANKGVAIANKSVAVGNKAATPAASPSLPGTMSKVNNIVRSLSNSGKAAAPGLASARLNSKTPVFQDSQQTQKAILDTELDLMNRQKEGTDTSELRRRVMALKEEAASLGLLGPKPSTVAPKPAVVAHGRGRGTMRGRGVGQVGARRWPPAGATSHTVDRRPRQLLITGFLADEKDELIAHLQEFGELESSSCDTSIPSLSVTFKLRLSAEKAASEGCNFNGKKLKMVWQKPGSVLTERNSAANAEPFVDKPGAKLLAELIDDVGKTKLPSAVVNSSSIDERRGGEADVGPDLLSEVRAEESKSNAVEKAVRLDSVTGEEEEVDEDIFLGLDEEEDDDNNEGGRPWRR